MDISQNDKPNSERSTEVLSSNWLSLSLSLHTHIDIYRHTDTHTMTASSTPGTTSPPSSLVMNGNGQPVIVNEHDMDTSRSLLENGSTITTNNNTDSSKQLNGCNNTSNVNNTNVNVKTGPSALKRPTDFLVLCLKRLFIAIVHIIVFAYTYLTLPIYYFLQKPWEVVEEASEPRAKPVNPDDPHSPWKSIFKYDYPYVLDKVETLDEMVNHISEYFSLKNRALGSRRVLREHVVLGPDGKTPLRIDGRAVKKRELSDYEWVSYEEMIVRKNNLARGLHLEGINRHDKLVILCETCAEYLMMELAIANAGVVQVNVFSTLGDSGIAHAIKETKSNFIFTSFELLPKVRSIIQANNLNIKKVIYINRRVENVTEEVERESEKLVENMGDIEFVSFTDVEQNGKLNGDLVEQQCKPLDKNEVAFISMSL